MAAPKKIREFLKRERRKKEWLATQLDVSLALVDKMLRGYQPKPDTVERLERLISPQK